MDLVTNIRNISDLLAQNYNLNLSVFFIIYLASFVPFYLGYLLILYGGTRTLEWNDILHFKLKNKLQWNSHTEWGLYIHMFGRIMPYAYILIYGRNLSIWVHIFIIGIILLAIFLFLRKIIFVKKQGSSNINIERKDVVENEKDAEDMWRIYNDTFEKVNILSPCKQSFDYHEFMNMIKEETVRKYIIYSLEKNVIGIGLITDNFKNTPWISKDYFKYNFSFEYSKNKIFYFMGLAIDESLRGNKYSIRLIEHIFDDLPHEAIMGFDHSRNINPLLHHFTKIIKQSSLIKRSHIDKQHYHVVRRK